VGYKGGMMLEWLFGSNSNNGKNKKLQETASEVSELFEKSKDDEFGR